MPPPPLLAPARELAHRLVLAWAEGALRARPSLAVDSGDAPGLLLVDGFAGNDYPAAHASAPDLVDACCRLLGGASRRPGVRVVLLEEDPVKLAWLTGRLAHSLPAEPLHREGDFLPTLNPRQGELADVPLLPLAGEAGASLVVLDPPAAGKLPMQQLRPWLEQPGTDLLVRVPVADLHRLARYPRMALADLPLHVKRTVEGLSSWLGDPRHGWLVRWAQQLPGGVDGAVEAVVGMYLERLSPTGGRPVRCVRVPGEAGMEYLIHVASSSASALLLNGALHEMRSTGRLPWPDDDGGMVRYVPSGELSLFGGGDAGPQQRPHLRVVDHALLAHRIAERFAGRSVPLEEVLGWLLDSDLLIDDVRRAMLSLRRDGRALFRALGGPDTVVAFPRAGSARVRPGRRRRSDVELDLDLDRPPLEE